MTTGARLTLPPDAPVPTKEGLRGPQALSLPRDADLRDAEGLRRAGAA